MSNPASGRRVFRRAVAQRTERPASALPAGGSANVSAPASWASPLSAEQPRFDKALRRQSKASVGWSVLRFLSDQIFSFLVFVLLARLLAPADIGAFALMAVFAEVFRAIST